MKIEEIIYLVHYTEPGRSEGGPVVTRHFDELGDAQKCFDRVMANPEQHSPSITRQTSIIIREDVAYAGSNHTS